MLLIVNKQYIFKLSGEILSLLCKMCAFSRSQIGGSHNTQEQLCFKH